MIKKNNKYLNTSFKIGDDPMHVIEPKQKDYWPYYWLPMGKTYDDAFLPEKAHNSNMIHISLHYKGLG